MTVQSKWYPVLSAEWSKHYPGITPTYMIHTPGRVNLIGEHVDHQAYPVCPCAVEQSIGALVSIEPKRSDNNFIEVANLDSTFAPKKFKDISDIHVSVQSKVWTNYIVSAYFGLIEYWLNGKKPAEVGRLIDPQSGLTQEQYGQSVALPQSPLNYSIRMLITSDLPAEVGLSSSAAIVVTVTLACAYAGGQPPSARTLADICSRSERYVGVASGGMDQAAVLLSKAGSATLIRFKPLESTCVQLPDIACLVIANSCRLSPKAKLAAKMYNKRVFELKAGCMALINPEERAKITVQEILDLQLRDVVQTFLNGTEASALDTVRKTIKKELWSRDDMTGILGCERRDAILDKLCGRDVWEKNEEFDVFGRLEHVLTETLRVEAFVSTAARSDLSDETKLRELGRLMNESGKSMKLSFDASCPEVDEITNLAVKYGAYGSRITGAGWGGCTISLLHKENKDAFIQAIKENYYLPLIHGNKTFQSPLETLPQSIDQLNSVIFATTPSAGAYVEML